MEKKIMMPESFVIGVMKLLDQIEYTGMEPNTKKICEKLQEQIEAKIERKTCRDIYSEYKIAKAGSAEREALRQKYLMAAAIHPEWQTEEEIPY